MKKTPDEDGEMNDASTIHGMLQIVSKAHREARSIFPTATRSPANTWISDI